MALQSSQIRTCPDISQRLLLIHHILHHASDVSAEQPGSSHCWQRHVPAPDPYCQWIRHRGLLRG